LRKDKAESDPGEGDGDRPPLRAFLGLRAHGVEDVAGSG